MDKGRNIQVICSTGSYGSIFNTKKNENQRKVFTLNRLKNYCFCYFFTKRKIAEWRLFKKWENSDNRYHLIEF